jgi:hypothetical protein
MVGDVLYCTIFFQIYLNGIFAIRAHLKVILAMFADGPTALTMNVVTIRFTNATLWQRNLMPSMIALNNFTTHTGFIVARGGNLK